MRSYLFILLLCFAGSVSAQLTKKQAGDTLLWKADVPLTPQDFQAKRSAYGKTVPAYTSSAIYLYQKDDNGSLNFYVEALFMKSKSYMKDQSVYILKHEQVHFDITEIYARKMRQRIAATDFTRVRDVVKEIQKIYDKIMAEWQREEERYDKETQHGINAATQNTWNERVAAQLVELNGFASPAVNIVRN